LATARKNPTDGDDIKTQRRKCLAHIALAAESSFELPRDEIWFRQQVQFLNEGGVLTPVDPNCLLIFIDETGHEEFADRKYPVFGLGGCACLAKDYDERLASPWRDLKRKHFGGAETPMHAAESWTLSISLH
jgi:hypothetical protein